MKWTHQKTDSGYAPSGGMNRSAVLKSRARALAYVSEPPTPVQAGIDVLVFTLANERYGVETGYVREVCLPPVLTPVPCTPPFVAGLINVRGDILAVIDLRAYMEMPESVPRGTGEVLIVEVGDSLFGISTDGVIGLSFIPLSDFKGPVRRMVARRELLLKGISPDQVSVLDVAGMLAEKKLWVHEEVSL